MLKDQIKINKLSDQNIKKIRRTKKIKKIHHGLLDCYCNP